MAEARAGARTRVERRGPAAWIVLDSPENRNALTAELVAELLEHLERLGDDDAVRAIVITGTGPAFCAGADLKNRGRMGEGGDGNPFVRVLRRISEGPKPVIAAVNGHAFGGGLGLVAAADLAVVSRRARMAFSEVRIGVIPAMISVVVVPKIGVGTAMRLFLTGERFGADEAVAFGLAHRAVEPEELEGAVAELADAIARGGPRAVAEAKRLVRAVAALPVDEAFAYAERRIAELFASEEAAEGMRAFAERRDPAWVPRPDGG